LSGRKKPRLIRAGAFFCPTKAAGSGDPTRIVGMPRPTPMAAYVA
jgi:hypothetical protein